MVQQIFFSPQVKRSVIISSKYKLSHELPNDLSVRILENYESSGKFQNSMEL